MAHPHPLRNEILVEVDCEEDAMPPISITALDDPISIVHIPIGGEKDKEQYSSRVYWTIERAASESVEFFNFTSNRLEIAILASRELVLSEWGQLAETDHDIRLSDGWRVFEIDSGDVGDEFNSGNYDSPHLRHVSAPLAADGISILYQSSYHADFLLVKESDFARAEEIFGQQGWSIQPTSNPSPRSSLYATFPSPFTPYTPTPITPRTPFMPSSLPAPMVAPSPTHQAYHLVDDNFTPRDQTKRNIVSRPTPPTVTPSPLPPWSRHITVLSAPLAYVGFHTSSPHFQLHMGLIQKYMTWPTRTRSCLPTTRMRSVGALGIGGWRNDAGRPFVSYTRTQDGVSLATEVRVIREMFKGLEEGMLCGDEIGSESESEGESEDGGNGESDDECGNEEAQEVGGDNGQGTAMSIRNPRNGYDEARSMTAHCSTYTLPDHTGVSQPEGEGLIFGDMEMSDAESSDLPIVQYGDKDEDGDGYADDGDDGEDTPRAIWNGQMMTPPPEYFSIPSRRRNQSRVIPLINVASQRSLLPALVPTSSISQYQVPAKSSVKGHRRTSSVPTTPGTISLPLVLDPPLTLPPPIHIQRGQVISAIDFVPRRPRMHARKSSGNARRPSVISASHPIPSGDAGLIDVPSRRRATYGGERLADLTKEKNVGKDQRRKKEVRRRKGRKRCLQLDLSSVEIDEDGAEAYHLDKSGLVTQFSTLLQRANIRMLYSSTFHTANILVDADDVARAKEILAKRHV